MNGKLWGVVVWALASSACAPQLAWRWAPDEALKVPPASVVGKKPAAYVLRERRILMVSRWTAPSYTQWLQHDVLAILSEKGFQYANVRVPYRGDAKIVSFAARTVAPDGTIQPVEPSNVHDDVLMEKKDDDPETKVRIFSFPNVKVGSLLEYQYTIEGPQIYGTIRELTRSELPVQRYTLELQGTKDIVWSSKAYNTDQEWTKSEEGDRWKLTWVMQDLPASVSKGYYLPSRWAREPWWVWTLRKFSRKGHVIDVVAGWNTAMRATATSLYYDDDWYEGFAPGVDLAGCTGAAEKRCKIERTLAWLHQKAPFDGFERSERKAKEVLVRGSAAGDEKARLAYRILRDAGLEVEFAVLTRRLTGLEDPDFPQLSAYNHKLLYLPAQDGLPGPTWLDPTCEFCALGEVPAWSKGVEAMILHATKAMNDTRPEVKVERLRVEGADPAEARLTRRSRAIVGADGAVKVHVELRSSGASLQDGWREMRTWSDADYDKNVEAAVKDRIPTAKLEGYTKLAVDDGLRAGSRTIDLSAPGHATLDGRQLIVPLSALAPDLSRLFRAKRRHHAIVVPSPEVREDVLSIEAPPGFAPAKLPPPVHADSSALETTIEVVAKGSTVEVTRRTKLKAGEHDAKDYAAVQAAVRAHVALRDAVVVFERQAP